MPKICENWLGLVNSCIYCAHQTRKIYQVLPYSVDFKTPRELWNPLSKTVVRKWSSIWYEGPVSIWNYCKAQKYFAHRTCKYFWHCMHQCASLSLHFLSFLKTERAQIINKLRQRQNGCYFAENILKLRFLYKKILCLDLNFSEICSQRSI